MPHLDYCVTVWGDCSDVARLEKLRKQTARIILNCHYMTPSKDIFSELRWLPLNEWVEYNNNNNNIIIIIINLYFRHIYGP